MDRLWDVHVFCKVQGGAGLGAKNWKTDDRTNPRTNAQNSKNFAPLRFAVLVACVAGGLVRRRKIR